MTFSFVLQNAFKLTENQQDLILLESNKRSPCELICADMSLSQMDIGDTFCWPETLRFSLQITLCAKLDVLN